MKVVLIAANQRDADWWAREQPFPPRRGELVVVTPRAKHAARGVAADLVLITSQALRTLTADQLYELRAVTLPCVMASLDGR